jgi:hypothetical protein
MMSTDPDLQGRTPPGAPDTELVARIADTLEENERLARTMRELRGVPRVVRPTVQARFVHRLCESPPLSQLHEVVEQARARCAEEVKDLSEAPKGTVVYPLSWDMRIEVDGQPVGQAQIHLDIEFDAVRLWRSLGTTKEGSGSGDAPADLNLSVSMGYGDSDSGPTPSLQFGPWSYPS